MTTINLAPWLTNFVYIIEPCGMQHSIDSCHSCGNNVHMRHTSLLHLLLPFFLLPLDFNGAPLGQGSFISLPAVDHNVEMLAQSTVHVVRHYIATRINTVVIRRHCLHCQDALQQQLQLFDQLLQSLSPHLTVLLHRGASDEQPWDYTLFVLNKASAFDQLYLSYSNPLNKREFYFLVVLISRESESELKASVKHICYVALRKRIVNVVVLAQRYNGEIGLYAYRLFQEHCIPGIHVYQSNQFVATNSLLKPELFPMRFTNLSHCALNVTGHQLPPHFMYRPPGGVHLPLDGELIDMKDLYGIDGELLRLLAKSLRFRIRLMIPIEKSEIFSAATLNGCFAQLASGQADLAIGGLSGSDERRSQFSTSAVYHQNNFVFVVRTERYFGPFGQLMRPFERIVWLCLLLTMLTAMICARCLRTRVHELKHPAENLLASTIGNPVPMHRVPQRLLWRYMFASWLLLTLVLRSAYQAKLFDVMRTQQYEALPQGLQGLLQQNYTLLSTGYHDFYPHRMTQVMNANFSQRYQQLQQAPKGRRLVTISLINNLAHWNRHHRKSSRLTHVRQPIYLYQLVIYFPNNTLFKFTIDRKIGQLISSGVMSQIERRYLRVDFADMAKKKHNRKEIVNHVTNDMLRGVYNCYVALMGMAGLLLILERLALRFRSLRHLIDWLQ